MKLYVACLVVFFAFQALAEEAKSPESDPETVSLTKRAVNRRPFFINNDWHRRMGWCSHAHSRVLVGDFNGDGNADMLCHDNTGRRWTSLADSQGRFTGRSMFWGHWCGHAHSQLHLGDFNGDGRTDMLCHDNHGRKWVTLAQSNGGFRGHTWYGGKHRWCGHGGSRLLIGDFNGDGRSDMMCQDKHNVWVTYALPGGTFNFRHWHRRSRWCAHGGAATYIADFNGDGRDDLLCHDNRGFNWVALTNHHGQFDYRRHWHNGQKWCGGAGRIHLGDFNGDGRADMMCHLPSNGYKWITIARKNIRRLFSGTTWHKNMRWCYGPHAQLLVADFNGDSYADMLCHSRRTGEKWIAFNHHRKPPGPEFKKISTSPVCFEARNNRPGVFRYHGPSRIVNGVLLVYRTGWVSCAKSNHRTRSRWGCGGLALNTVVTDQFNFLIYPKKSYIHHPRGLWYRLPGQHSKLSSSLLLSNVNTPFHLTSNMVLKVWYGEDLKGFTEGDNAGRVCVDVYGVFAK